MIKNQLILAVSIALGLSNPSFAGLIAPAYLPEIAAPVQDAGKRLHLRGLQALEENDLAAAERAFRDYMQLDPRAAQPLLGMADLALRRKQPKVAWDWLDKASAVAPRNALVYQAIGRYHFANSENIKAIEALKKAQRLEPGNASILIDQAEIYMQALRQPEQAVLTYQNALRMVPRHAGAHYGLGTALLASGKIVDAQAELNQAAVLAPENPLPSLSLGTLYLSQGKADYALTAFDAALKIQPDLLPAILAKGDIYLNRLDFTQALNMFQNALKLTPENYLILLKLGQTYQGLNRFGEAEMSYRAALRIRPKLALAYNNLAWISIENKKNLAQAEQWARKANDLAPEISGFIDTLGWVYRAQGKTEAAESTIIKASKIDHPSAEIFYHLGVVSLDLKKNKEAEAAFRKSLSLQKNHFPAQQALIKLITSKQIK
ncbi:MAG: tetratricopeptide repeat protein [Pseudomonadota bacterium]